MYRIGKTFTFSAGHHLPDLPEGHKCRRPHGHNYTVTLELHSPDVDEHGFVIDYGDLAQFGTFILTTLDHRDLNEVLDPLDITPTAERLAEYLYGVAGTLGLEPLLECVRVSETPNTFAEFRPW